MSKKQYDEKQIIERGKSFHYALTGAIVVNIIIYLLSDFVGIGFANGAICLINIGLPIAIYMLSMIIKNGYDGVSNAGALLISILILVVVLVYWIKKHIEKKSENDE